MTTILATFGIALILSLVFTPLAKKLGVGLGAVDMPNTRKVHTRPIPRSGGLAIFVAFLLSLIAVSFLRSSVSELMIWDRKIVFALAGGVICFCVGLFDDFCRLNPIVKFLFQVICASLAFMGGMAIQSIGVFGIALNLGPFDYFVTVFWFVLFINAVNLVDGLDGLAGGIVVFASVVMVILSVLEANYLTAMFFSALAGSVLGFLRYNFNPASIFMGDGGSYFLGYAIACLSIMGSIKSQLGAAILIPLLALGVPLFDTILSPVRRWVTGRKMFRPDNGHVHHRLKNMGLSTKKAVLIIYGITLVLCLSAVIITNLRDERAGLFLIILGLGVAVFIQKLGYLEYIGSDKIFGWFKDATDMTGFSRERRTFLNMQMAIDQSRDKEVLWHTICDAAQALELDYVEMKISGFGNRPENVQETKHNFSNGNIDPSSLDWNKSMYVILPLVNEKHKFGSMAIAKNIEKHPLTPLTLRRIEQLRRTVVSTLAKMQRSASGP